MAECRRAHCPPPPPPYIRTGPLHPNFSDLGKVPRDLLTKGFSPGHVLSFSCLGPKSSLLTSTATIQTASTVGVTTASVVEGCRKHELSFSTLNNQVLSDTFHSLSAQSNGNQNLMYNFLSL
jgi:hypothetical protein